MTFYRRRLPHVYEAGQFVFLTWRLQGSLPSHRPFPASALNSGRAFAAMDRLLDQASDGLFYLRPIYYNASTLGHYLLHAFVACRTMFIYWLLQPCHCRN